jgi:hypothetical protein
MPEAVSNETNDDLRSDLSAEWDKLTTTEDAPAAEPALEAPAAPETPGETAKAAADRARDEHGRFVKKAAEAAGEAAQAQDPTKAVQQPAVEQTQLQAPQTRVIGPPPGWSIAAKAEFDKLSPAIKEAVAKREEEVSNGFAKMQAYKGMEPYVEQAARAGTTVSRIMENFMNAEKLLATDFVSGVQSLCQHFNVNPAALVNALSGQLQGGHQPPQPQNPVLNELNALKSRIAQFEQEREQQAYSGINAEISAFSAKPENKYFENVKQTMAKLLNAEAATTLQDAYDQACWAHPEIRALLINEQAETKAAEAQRKASEARRASGSLNPGSPIPGASLNGGSSQKSVRQLLEESWGSATI